MSEFEDKVTDHDSEDQAAPSELLRKLVLAEKLWKLAFDGNVAPPEMVKSNLAPMDELPVKSSRAPIEMPLCGQAGWGLLDNRMKDLLDSLDVDSPENWIKRNDLSKAFSPEDSAPQEEADSIETSQPEKAQAKWVQTEVTPITYGASWYMRLLGDDAYYDLLDVRDVWEVSLGARRARWKFAGAVICSIPHIVQTHMQRWWRRHWQALRLMVLQGAQHKLPGQKIVVSLLDRLMEDEDMRRRQS
ncbi:hypothetical protein [Acanthopleuribacter pedis]|uniref:Uncharacterized protein n=1 Tax=Acanthopleuribacter pedis TaxID=442870 RepID=A0A8J7U7S2_9BACT|nr:hypothetical protein [Acanthopleuribacter pedis]MBO1321711.1 hypothetical protein [Acanthopleuribacter pedis]